MKSKIRQPIITVAGHVDHGKTSILDKLRGTNIQEGEAGGITQKISSTILPAEVIKKRAGGILEKFKIPLEIPGFLFIDTPGHAAFTNIRKRGGSLADLAVLVVDVNEGIKPQTAEVLQILKANRTPFIIALNKIDNIGGWKTSESLLAIESLNNQAVNVKQVFDERYYTLIGALNSYKIDAELYFNIKDFTKKVAVVPCSARTGEGIFEILAMLCALSQKFLMSAIAISGQGKGVILEVKKEKAGNYLEAILHDGVLKQSDEVAIASFGDVVVTKIRNIQSAKPLNKGYETVKEISAAAGLRLQVTTKEEVLPGMPFSVVNNNLEEIKETFAQEISEEVRIDGDGIVVKADSLGSLEALLTLLRQNNVRVARASIGDVTKKDIYVANSLDDEDKVILGFNVEITEDAEAENKKGVKVITDPVVYKLIENYSEWKVAKQQEIEREKLKSLPTIAKVTILDFVFRNTSPAIFGVRVDGGKIVHGLQLINSNDEKIGKIKSIQHEKDTLQVAENGKEVAISIPGVNFERQLKVGESLYTNLGESQFREFKANKHLLSADEKAVLSKIAEIKRKAEATWGL